MSPRIASLPIRNTYESLTENKNTDIAIIWGGIAGCATAYFLLKNTNKEVYLVEWSKIAHGASWHNAGLCSTYFERDIQDYIMLYGYERTMNTQKGILQANILLEEMIARLANHGQHIPFTKTIETTTLITKEDILRSLATIKTLQESGIAVECLLIWDHVQLDEYTHNTYGDYYKIISSNELHILAKNNNPDILAVEIRNTILANTALLCDELIHYLWHVYKDRFFVHEYTMIKDITLHQNYGIATTQDKIQLEAKHIILCTNWFTHFTIQDTTQIWQHTFHKKMTSYISHMLGFTSSQDLPDHAYCYTVNTEWTTTMFEEKPYYYMTLRPHNNQQLICIGGEETIIKQKNIYTSDYTIPAAKAKHMREYIHQQNTITQKEDLYEAYQWHGIIWYTPDWLRIVWPDIHNNVLQYNVWCNGIGVLPSIYGAQRISDIINKKPVESCLFDVKK